MAQTTANLVGSVCQPSNRNIDTPVTQTTANLAGSVCQPSSRNMDTPEAVISACEEGDTSAQ